MARVVFVGGAGEVTGCCFLVEAHGARFLIDCGLRQGSGAARLRNREPFPFDPGELDCVLLTHAHIDHSGLLPRLCAEGFAGRILATAATRELCRVILADSAHIHEMEAAERGDDPLFTKDDVRRTLEFFRAVPYEAEVPISQGMTARFRDAGHILGSASAEVALVRNRPFHLAFSGDVGNGGQAILRDPRPVDRADLLLLESTYGNRRHEEGGAQRERLRKVVAEAAEKDGKVLIPAFALGRTQEILYHLNALVEKEAVPRLPVYVDSPLAISATEIFRRHPECYDEQARRLLAQGDRPLDFPGLSFTRSPEESKELDRLEGAAVIVAASGMCDAGRIQFHLHRYLPGPENTVLIAGFQARGTLGRALADGAREVEIKGHRVPVRARIVQLHGFSAHADRDGLLAWVRGMREPTARVMLVHGEPEATGALAGDLGAEPGIEPHVPQAGEAVEF